MIIASRYKKTGDIFSSCEFESFHESAPKWANRKKPDISRKKRKYWSSILIFLFKNEDQYNFPIIYIDTVLLMLYNADVK